MPIPEEHADEMVAASLYFLRAVGNYRGSEAAMDIWSRLSDLVDPDLKGLVFTAMLNGASSGHITITSIDNANVISVIKALRTHDRRRLSLMDAKVMCDSLRESGTSIKLEVDPGKARSVRTELIGLGCVLI